MRLTAPPALLALLLFATASASDAPPPVEDTSPADFDAAVAEGHSLLLLHAPWCGHCKAIKPAWEKLAALFADEPGVNIVSVDADANKGLAERFGVEGFPTLKYLPPGGGAPEDYSGGRELSDLVSFINGKAGTDVTPDGSAGPRGGLLPGVHGALEGFAAADREAQEEKVAAAEELVRAEGAAAEEKWTTYARVAARVMDGGAAWIAKEKARLANMIQNNKGSLTAKQRKQFQIKLNVVSAFDEL